MNKISLLLALTFDFLQNLRTQLLVMQAVNQPPVNQPVEKQATQTAEDLLREIEQHPDIQPYTQAVETLKQEIYQITVDQIKQASQMAEKIDELQEYAKQFNEVLKPQGFGHQRKVSMVNPLEIIRYQTQQIQLESEVRQLEAQIAQEDVKRIEKIIELNKKEIELATASLSIIENPTIASDRSKFDLSAVQRRVTSNGLNIRIKGAAVPQPHHTLFEELNELSEEMSHMAKKAKFEEAKEQYKKIFKKLFSIDIKFVGEFPEELVHDIIKSIETLNNRMSYLEQQKLAAQEVARTTTQIAQEYTKLAVAQSNLPAPSCNQHVCHIDLKAASAEVRQQAQIVQEAQRNITELTKKLDHKLNIKTMPFNFFTTHELNMVQNLAQRPVPHILQTSISSSIEKAQKLFMGNQIFNKPTPNTPVQTLKTPHIVERTGIKMSQSAAQAAQSFLRVLKIMGPK